MPDLDIPAIRRALAEATPGRWVAETASDPSIYAEDSACIVYQTCSGAGDKSDTGIENASLIVLLRNNAEALLAEIERLRQIAEAAREYREAEGRHATILMGEPGCDETSPIYKQWYAAFIASHQRETDTRAALDAALGGK